MIHTGEPIDTTAARRWGLVDAVASNSDFEGIVEGFVARALGGEADGLRARRVGMIAAAPGPAAAALK